MQRNRNYPPQTVSCIVPVYDVGSVIHKCIDSLLAQTYWHLEIIIVDDGSTDGSSQICDEYAKADKRITVIHQDNCGVSKARNEGLKRATGDRIMFVDADDETSPTLVADLVAEDADLVTGGFRSNQCQISLPHSRYDLDEIPHYYATHFHRLYSTVPWGKLYRRSIITDNSITFDSNLRLGEDLIFNLQYLLHCSSVVTIGSFGYIYKQTGIGADRYRMQLHEIEYTIDRVGEYTSRLEQKYGTRFNSEAIKQTLISTYPLRDILDGHADEYKKLYFNAFPKKSLGEFINNRICSPVIRGIYYVKHFIKSGKYRDALMMMRKMRQYESREERGARINLKGLTLIEQLVYLCCRCCI